MSEGGVICNVSHQRCGNITHCIVVFYRSSFIMDRPKRIWLLLVDHKFEALGRCFSVRTSQAEGIADLKDKVKEEAPETLSRARVDPCQLSVWKTKGANIIDESTLECLTEILGRIDVRDQDTIEELRGRKRIADL
jgi:hypothetical protein